MFIDELSDHDRTILYNILRSGVGSCTVPYGGSSALCGVTLNEALGSDGRRVWNALSETHHNLITHNELVKKLFWDSSYKGMVDHRLRLDMFHLFSGPNQYLDTAVMMPDKSMSLTEFIDLMSGMTSGEWCLDNTCVWVQDTSDIALLKMIFVK